MRQESEILDWLLDENTSVFHIFCQDAKGEGTLELLKSDGPSSGFDEDKRPIGGWCSTETKDRQDEVVVAKGLDFSPFVKWGHFNDNHKQGTADILGWPTMAEPRGWRWYTKGHLYKGTPEKPIDADRVWELAKSMVLSNAPRRLGFSIEGKVLERNGHNRITRAIVRNVAITNCPVNPECEWSILAKAFAPINELDDTRKKWKALMAGNAHPVSHGGDIFRQEHLESEDDLETVKRPTKKSFNDAVSYVRMLRPGWSQELCERFVRYASKRHQKAA